MQKVEKYHFIGIGGIGMSGLARILLSQNKEISGSDIAHNYVIEGLLEQGAKVSIGHDSKHVSKDMTIVYSSDIKPENPEYLAALQYTCPLLHRSELLVKLMRGYKTLAVAGTHGKTTTSALLAWVFHQTDLDPSFAVGGMLPQFQSNAHHGKGEFFVAEADESDGTFLKYDPFGAIVTNIDNDHLIHYGSEEALITAFKQFMDKVASPSLFFWCGDDPHLKNFGLPGFSYGFGGNNHLKISNFKQSGWNIEFDINFNHHTYTQIQVALTGRHNALNASAVFGLALQCGIAEEKIRAALKMFAGVKRRCEKKGEVQSVLILDDYAHHPTEIKTTLNAIRNAVQERRLIAVFQPHRFTRTNDCLGYYGTIFDEADEVVVTEIYAAGEQVIPNVTHEKILEELKQHSQASAKHVLRNDLLAYLTKQVRPHDVIVTLGAGDITKLGNELVGVLQKQGVKKFEVGVIFGGRSGEHSISLLSARHIFQSLNNELYSVKQFAISRSGKWVTGDQLLPEKGDLHAEIQVKDEVSLMPPEVMQELQACDVLFPMLHGPNGEDGTIQGFFEILDKPYVGCDFRSAAICMDKATTKALVLLAGIPTVPFVSFQKDEWQTDSTKIVNEILNGLRLPVFVKPVHLGSTIGVQKVDNWDQLEEAINTSFKVDSRILVENGLKVREIEFAVMGNAQTVYTFPPGEVFTEGQVYDFQSKYGDQAAGVQPCAKMTKGQMVQGMELAKKAYRAVGCNGMARVDFFLDEHGKFWLNEINPIPGFTRTSLYPQICRFNGLDSKELMDKLIILALQRKRKGM